MKHHYPVSKPSLSRAEKSLVFDALDSGWITQGPFVHEFEARFAATVERRFGIATSSGTTALHLILAALGCMPGHEVIVPDISFVATANAVKYTGATPVLCDVQPTSWGMDPDKLEELLKPNTFAIVVVHLYGQPASMGRILEIAKRRNIYVIEDAAEGLGGTCEGRPMGSFGYASAFSFYANKIITTGEGGMVVTDDAKFADRLKLFRGQGMEPGRRYFHPVCGFNYRMTDVSAALGIAQLNRFPEFLEARRTVMQVYHEAFSDYIKVGEDSAPWLFTFLLPAMVNREELMRALAAQGIETRPTFVPMHELPMYHARRGDFPFASAIGSRGLSLPTHAEMTQADAIHVATVVRSTLEVLAATAVTA